MSVLVRCQIVGLFVNTLTPDDKYSRQNIENFLQQLQMQLSQKQNSFSQIFIGFLGFTSNLEHFNKEDESPTLIISYFQNCLLRMRWLLICLKGLVL